MGVGKRIRISFFVPRNSDTVRVGTSATPSEVDRGVVSAGAAFAKWACRPTEERIRFAERFAEEIRKREDQLARLISRKMGKSVCESRTEVAVVVGKVNLTIEGMLERRIFVSKKKVSTYYSADLLDIFWSSQLHVFSRLTKLIGDDQSQESAAPTWYSVTLVSKKFFSFVRSIVSLIQENGLADPYCAGRLILSNRRSATY